MLSTVMRYLKGKEIETAAAPAYDIWAESYDSQPHNLMLALDEDVFARLAPATLLQGKHIVDIGCGTGRHWGKIFAAQPASLAGYDVSEGMLNKLKAKYPQANTFMLVDDELASSATSCSDLIVSTLTIAHIKDLRRVFAEWDRILKTGGDLIITDFHPELLANGGARTFSHGNKSVTIKNYVHPVKHVEQLGAELGWKVAELDERKIDESVRHWYEKQNALHIYEKYKGMPVIFGMRLKKGV